MITAVQYLSRKEFEGHIPDVNEVAISIGDPDQEEPACLKNYVAYLRTQFLDLEPSTCVEHGISQVLCMTKAQADDIAFFVRTLHGSRTDDRVMVHCEAGVSRSAAVALAICAYASCPLPRRMSMHANLHVVKMLSEAMGIPIPIPPDVSHTELHNWF